ncbi:DUF4469 domain-containing protein [Rhodocytophaga rosea]|uniref:DUF4469 domain-containing protein n=1 Tax=Rhodocytophaga rosea TaxID=2704465 RepID=A0A6C0GJ31_9BACT|nr:DUF4469 domain-containing protein [Rhodocytophaga rosea]QHT68038.1 DUF4469 domain-containing protein [Rhodocytophaga rosea]
MSSQYFSNQKKSEGRIHSDSVVVRSGNDRLQSDIINLMMSRNDNITREQAITLLETYASAFEKILNQQPTSIAARGVSVSSDYHDSNIPAIDHIENYQKVSPIPVLTHCLNVVSHTQTVMWGCVVQLYGKHLSFDRSDEKQGIFMIESQTRLPNKIHTLVRVKAENIIFMIPGGLPPGNYNVELRARCPHSGDLHTGMLPDIIHVII